MMVVEVLTTNCQVSEKPKNGPATAQATMPAQARTKVIGFPAPMETLCENRVKRLVSVICHSSRAGFGPSCSGTRTRQCTGCPPVPVCLCASRIESPATSFLSARIGRFGVSKLIIGTAGWSIGRESASHFTSEGSGLERYASLFSVVEIDTTFYRSHRQSTYERWAASVPPEFRFAVKCPKTVTHDAKLISVGDLLTAFVDEVSALGNRLGPLLVQLPPHLKFDPDTAATFFDLCHAAHPGPWLIEPRHLSWFEPQARSLLIEKDMSRVGADPAVIEDAADPAGTSEIAYWRLHGSPKIYYSSYSPDYLAALRKRLDASKANQTWCIFDNTASGAALKNALDLHSLFQGKDALPPPAA